MKSISIKGEKREQISKLSTKILRNSNKIPCVIYGNGINIHFSVDILSLKNIIYTSKAYIINIEWLNGGNTEAILQDVQFHPVSDIILHADFYYLQPKKSVIINVPLKISGRSIGVSKGGFLQIFLRKIKIKSIPKNLPDDIKIDISSLEIGQKILIKDLLTYKYNIEHNKNEVVLIIKSSRLIVKNSQNDIQVKDDKIQVKDDKIQVKDDKIQVKNNKKQK